VRHDLNHIKLCRFLAENRARVSTGAEALIVLAGEPGTTFSALELSLRLDIHHGVPELLLELLDNAFTFVPYCDARALREYQHRVDQLEEKRALLLKTRDNPDLSEIDWEIGFLRAEIRRNTKPSGDIKNHNRERKLAYLRLKNPLSRLIARAQREDPALAAYIRQNLITDHDFAWLGQRIDLPEKGASNREMPLAA
jgi:hypothetical protein